MLFLFEHRRATRASLAGRRLTGSNPFQVAMITGAALLAIGLPGAAGADIGSGDRAWQQRAEALDGQLARPLRIEESLRHYREALALDPDSMAAAWKLLRSLHYAIDFTTLPAEAKSERLAEALELAAPQRRERLTGSDADRAHYLFWSAIALGVQAQRAELMTIVREGLATRMHDAANQSIELDSGVDDGGALRLLSRLHATLPRVPFITGWVDRSRAMTFAERAHSLDPTHPGNRLILGLALLDDDPARRDEAVALVTSVAGAAPRATHQVEDLAIREQARERLARP